MLNGLSKRCLLWMIFLVIAILVGIGGYNLFKSGLINTLIKLFYKLDHYDIKGGEIYVRLEPANEEIKVDAKLKVEPTSVSGRWLIFALDPELKDVTARIKGVKVKVWRIWALCGIWLPKEVSKQSFTLELKYHGRPEGIIARHADSYIKYDSAFLRTDSLWLPFEIRRETSLYSFDFTINTPAELMGITAGHLIGSEKISSNERVTYWKDAKTMQIVIGPQLKKSYQQDGLTLDLYLLSEYDYLKEKIADAVFEILKRYENWFGPFIDISYITIVQEPGNTVNGLCDANMIVLPEKRFRDSKNELSEDFYQLLAHELAHLWWNNREYTMEILFGNQWYVEGLAEYSALLSLKAKYNDDLVKQELEKKRMRLRRINPESFKPLVEYSWMEYSIVPYYKGTFMHRALHKKLGDKNFFDFLGKLYHTPQSKKTPELVLHILNELNLTGYEDFIKHWLEESQPVDLAITGIEQIEESDRTQIVLEFAGGLKKGQKLTILLKGEGYLECREVILDGTEKITLEMAGPATFVQLDPFGEYFDLNPENNFNTIYNK